MNTTKSFKTMILGISLILTTLNEVTLARGYQDFEGPYNHIQYDSAFDQKALHEKHQALLTKLGCAGNLPQLHKNSNSTTQPEKKLRADITLNNKVDASNEIHSTAENTQQELAAYQQDCMNILNNSRRWSLAAPLVKIASDIGLRTVITNVVSQAILQKKDAQKSNDSTARDSAFYRIAEEATYSLPDIGKSAYNLIFWPENSIEELEDHFAKNKAFIPQDLWPKITKKFTEFRNGNYEAEEHRKYINFALGFTIYKPKPAIQTNNAMSINNVKTELNKRIDLFFSDYSNKRDILYIKINVEKFIDTLLSDQASNKTTQAPRYVYLHGSGGIGKTHFAQTLSNWIGELIPESVQFQDVIVNDREELEGSNKLPGVFLNIYRDQLVQNKRGSVVVIDEATWLNDSYMISAAKRTFNGNQSKLTTSYFGEKIDGVGVTIEMPPMLIFLASNDKINDPALASRFDIIKYPTPKKDALIEHAYKIAKASNVLEYAKYTVDKKIITEWITNLDEKNCNFRYVASNVESLLLTNMTDTNI